MSLFLSSKRPQEYLREEEMKSQKLKHFSQLSVSVYVPNVPVQIKSSLSAKVEREDESYQVSVDFLCFRVRFVSLARSADQFEHRR